MSISRAASAESSLKVSSHTTRYSAFLPCRVEKIVSEYPTFGGKHVVFWSTSSAGLLINRFRTEPQLCFLETKVDVRRSSFSPAG